ncbi:hypothetical protein J1605_018198 [Eschrichtius robustus]|uniref:Uncharacterized protein n=1 Tax=Eschrichtius robustus TaxID=9764 RepID=A0AB34HYI6_ESCRO|nr:hypothetical protein J1605_018198 [Eschrichtius robustus]
MCACAVTQTWRMRWVGQAGLKTMAWVPAESAVEELMPRLLPVEPCDLTDSFDPNVPPRTPQEYLRRVQIEAAQCPDVVVAQIDPKKLKRKQSVNVSDANLLLKDIPPLFSGNSSKWHSFQLFGSQNLKMKKAGKNFVWVRGYMLKGLLHQVKVLELIMYK